MYYSITLCSGETNQIIVKNDHVAYCPFTECYLVIDFTNK